MEDQAIYKDEFLQETAKLVQQILDERGCHLVPVGQFIGSNFIYKIVIEKIKKDGDNS
jgi:hypothetical protein